MFRKISERFGINPWVLAGIVALAVLLGALNTLRVFEEQRVPWFGAPDDAESENGEKSEEVDA